MIDLIRNSYINIVNQKFLWLKIILQAFERKLYNKFKTNLINDNL